MTLYPRCAAPEAVPTVAPWNELPQTITVLVPACFRIGSRVEPLNFSGPPWRYHSPVRGLMAGSMMSSGVALPSAPTRLYQTTMLWARASSCMRLIFGIAATQRGRALQPAFMMSSSNSATVEGSTVTSFSSGGGGATAALQSEMPAATAVEAATAAMSATMARRNGVMVCSRYVACSHCHAPQRRSIQYSHLFPRRLGGELRPAHAEAAARVLPELFGGVQVADGAGHGVEIEAGEF